MSPRVALFTAFALFAVGCGSANETDQAGSSTTSGTTDTNETAEVPRGEVVDFGPAPSVPDGALAPQTAAALDEIFGNGILPEIFTGEQNAALETLGQSGDPRVGWILMDTLRFVRDAPSAERLANAASELLDHEFETFSAWGEATDRLIAWDIPAPPGYLDVKRSIYSTILPEWEPLFDSSGDMDWRHVSWGGVRIDDRAFDQTDEPCNCIPAADNPLVQSAEDATWLAADDVVFGVEINGESRAYPRQIMEVREMVNDTLGGRDFAMPYCTLCGAAQVWLTDDLPGDLERPVLRTSGLLSRSNKVMYDLNTFSIFDTFLGTAQTGPLAELGIALNQHSVVTSTWADWVEAHPDTTVLIEELALGRDFDFRNGRDADGPIFPIGDVDPRLPVQEDILGVITPAGDPLAIHVASALATLDRGEPIEVDGVRVIKDGGGLRAEDLDGNDLGSHQAFWFAWSQFHEDTALWPS